MDVDKLRHGQQKGTRVEGGECTVHREKAGGAGFVEEKRPRGHLIAARSYLEESRREKWSQTLRRRHSERARNNGHELQ